MEQRSPVSAEAKQGTDATGENPRQLWWAEASIWTDRVVLALGRACPCEGTSTSRRKFEPLWGLCQATRGLPFTVQRNGFAIVALK
jgi:hypothetical protein